VVSAESRSHRRDPSSLSSAGAEAARQHLLTCWGPPGNWHPRHRPCVAHAPGALPASLPSELVRQRRISSRPRRQLHAAVPDRIATRNSTIHYAVRRASYAAPIRATLFTRQSLSGASPAASPSRSSTPACVRPSAARARRFQRSAAITGRPCSMLPAGADILRRSTTNQAARGQRTPLDVRPSRRDSSASATLPARRDSRSAGCPAPISASPIGYVERSHSAFRDAVQLWSQWAGGWWAAPIAVARKCSHHDLEMPRMMAEEKRWVGRAISRPARPSSTYATLQDNRFCLRILAGIPRDR